MREAYLSAALEATARAAAILREELQNADLGIEYKGPTDPVTRADRRSEEVIAAILLGRFPAHRLLGEETGERGTAGGPVWVVDPLDGTVNFAHRYPCFCVSLALWAEGRVMLGVVHDPVQTLTYWAVAEGPAMLAVGVPGVGDEQAAGEVLLPRLALASRPLRVSATSQLGDSLCVTGFPYRGAFDVEGPLRRFCTMTRRVQGVRRDGSAALDLCQVADGRFDAFWEEGLHPWDVAAGVLLVERAGGRVTGLTGEPLDVFAPRVDLVASNGRLHDAIVGAMGG